MEPILQALVVGLIVAASAVYATWRLMPARTRLRVLDGLKPSDGTAAGRWLLRLRKGALAELTHGCASCSHAADHVQRPRPPERRA